MSTKTSETKRNKESSPQRASSSRAATASSRQASENAERGAVPSSVYQVLARPGAPLDEATRREAQSRFAFDLSQVRIHHDAEAAASARAVSADAYSVGRHIVFASGRYALHTPAGQELMRHELTHVVQRGNSMLQGPLVLGSPHARHEHEASVVARGGSPSGLAALPANILARRSVMDDLDDKYDRHPQPLLSEAVVAAAAAKTPAAAPAVAPPAVQDGVTVEQLPSGGTRTTRDTEGLQPIITRDRSKPDNPDKPAPIDRVAGLTYTSKDIKHLLPNNVRTVTELPRGSEQPSSVAISPRANGQPTVVRRVDEGDLVLRDLATGARLRDTKTLTVRDHIGSFAQETKPHGFRSGAFVDNAEHTTTDGVTAGTTYATQNNAQSTVTTIAYKRSSGTGSSTEGVAAAEGLDDRKTFHQESNRKGTEFESIQTAVTYRDKKGRALGTTYEDRTTDSDTTTTNTLRNKGSKYYAGDQATQQTAVGRKREQSTKHSVDQFGARQQSYTDKTFNGTAQKQDTVKQLGGGNEQRTSSQKTEGKTVQNARSASQAAGLHQRSSDASVNKGKTSSKDFSRGQVGAPPPGAPARNAVKLIEFGGPEETKVKELGHGIKQTTTGATSAAINSDGVSAEIERKDEVGLRKPWEHKIIKHLGWLVVENTTEAWALAGAQYARSASAKLAGANLSAQGKIGGAVGVLGHAGNVLKITAGPLVLEVALETNGLIGGEASASGNAQAGAGVGAGVGAAASGFAGAKGSLVGTLAVNFHGHKIGDGSVTYQASAGAGFNAAFNASYYQGNLALNASLAATVGVGAGVGFKGMLNMREVAAAGVFAAGDVLSLVSSGAKDTLNDLRNRASQEKDATKKWLVNKWHGLTKSDGGK